MAHSDMYLSRFKWLIRTCTCLTCYICRSIMHSNDISNDEIRIKLMGPYRKTNSSRLETGLKWVQLEVLFFFPNKRLLTKTTKYLSN